MSEHSQERRRFHRVVTDKPVVVQTDDGPQEGKTLDVSLRGLLIEPVDGWQPEAGVDVSARIRLDGELCCIEMEGQVVHVDPGRIGIHVTSVDLESAARLRRMVELNLGDTEDLERDLAELVKG
jgi:hypothetical protein